MALEPSVGAAATKSAQEASTLDFYAPSDWEINFETRDDIFKDVNSRNIADHQNSYLQITRECNNRCIFCSNPQFNGPLPLAEAKQQIDEFKSKGVTEIILTGGEPTSSPHLFQIIDYVLQQGLYPRMISNGVIMGQKPELAAKLYQLGLRTIHISVHHYTHKAVDVLSKRPGNHRFTLQGMRNIIKAGINLHLNATLNAANAAVLDKFIAWYIKHFPEINHYVFNNLDPGFADGNIRSRASKNAWIIARYQDFQLSLPKMALILMTNNKTFRIERVPLCYMQGFEHHSTEARKIAKGQVYLCSFMEPRSLSKIRTVLPGHRRIKFEACKQCSLASLCTGFQEEYFEFHEPPEVFPSSKDPNEVVRRIQKDEGR